MKIAKLRSGLKNIKIEVYAREISKILDKVNEVKSILDLKDLEIEKLIDKWYTFSEILAGSFNDKWVFIPEEIITTQAKAYLLSNNFNTYANQWV